MLAEWQPRKESRREELFILCCWRRQTKANRPMQVDEVVVPLQKGPPSVLQGSTWLGRYLGRAKDYG